MPQSTQEPFSREDLEALRYTQKALAEAGDPRAAKLESFLVANGYYRPAPSPAGLANQALKGSGLQVGPLRSGVQLPKEANPIVRGATSFAVGTGDLLQAGTPQGATFQLDPNDVPGSFRRDMEARPSVLDEAGGILKAPYELVASPARTIGGGDIAGGIGEGLANAPAVAIAGAQLKRGAENTPAALRSAAAKAVPATARGLEMFANFDRDWAGLLNTRLPHLQRKAGALARILRKRQGAAGSPAPEPTITLEADEILPPREAAAESLPYRRGPGEVAPDVVEAGEVPANADRRTLAGNKGRITTPRGALPEYTEASGMEVLRQAEPSGKALRLSEAIDYLKRANGNTQKAIDLLRKDGRVSNVSDRIETQAILDTLRDEMLATESRLWIERIKPANLPPGTPYIGPEVSPIYGEGAAARSLKHPAQPKANLEDLLEKSIKRARATRGPSGSPKK